MLHLVAIIFRLSWLLALFKLATTVFHLEFGISRHYLRLLEIVFRIGQKKFGPVEADEDDPDGSSSSRQPEQEQEVEEGADDGRGSGPRLRPTSFSGDLVKPKVLKRRTVANLQAPKIRRISTPDGPPVFLLDQCDYDFTDDDCDQSLDCEQDFANQGPEFGLELELDVEGGRQGAGRGKEKGEGEQELELGLESNLEQTNTNDSIERDKREQKADDSMQSPSSGLGGRLGGKWKGPAYYSALRKHEFQLYDPCKLVVRGISALIDDDVIKRFTPEQLKSWNLLTRTNAKNYQFMSRSMGLFWLVGLLMRYLILLPLRIMFTVTGLLWLIGTMGLIGVLPRGWRLKPYKLMSLMSFRMLACGLTSRLEFHNRQFRANLGDICVANHTSPLDVVLLACDNCYALVGQRHGGILGLLEMVLSSATEHVWFDRAEMRDRQLVTRRLKEHIDGKSNLPVLIFPEGTCINNSAVMMFRKGSFETTDRVCPVAIKYDPRFGDPFWNSSKQGYVQYLLMMMSSWAIKCDVWYLAPMDRLAGESSAEFANRVKAEIARQGGLDDLAWDGQLKRSAPKTVWKLQQQEDFANRLKLE